MAKRKSGDGSENGKKSVMGYFRDILTANPKLLETRSNDEIIEQWLKDHPESSEVPQTVKNSLANVKSMMRRKKRKRGRKPGTVSASAAKVTQTTTQTSGRSKVHELEPLEIQIDECLILANNLGREKLESVIRHLRIARREIVWLMGQSQSGV